MEDLLYFLIVFSSIVFIICGFVYKKGTNDKEGFIVANRTLTTIPAAMSIAATWIWAPSLFLSAEISYNWGIKGLVWFLVPNFFTLILFAFFANKIREQMPYGYTLSEFIKKRISNRVGHIYTFELLILSICAIAVQLVAGGNILKSIINVDYLNITIFMVGIPLIYTLFSGLRASVITDVYQYTFMIFGMLILLYFTLNNSCPEIDFFKIYLGTKMISTQELLFSFGIPTTIGLLAGAFGSQEFYQRTYAIQKENVFKSYILSAFLFIIIPLMMSVFGFIAISNNLNISNTFLTNLFVVSQYTNPYFVSIFLFVIICGLVSTIDSAQSSISSIFSTDFKIENSMIISRFTMIIGSIIALIIANIPNIGVLQLFLIYGMIRTSVFGVTLLSIGTKINFNEKYVFFILAVVIAIFTPLYAYAVLFKKQILILSSILCVAFIPPLIALITKKTIQI